MITKTILLSAGMMKKKKLRVSNPPAEAPMPTIGNGIPFLGFSSCSTFSREFLLARGAFFFFVGMVVAFLFEGVRKRETVQTIQDSCLHSATLTGNRCNGTKKALRL